MLSTKQDLLEAIEVAPDEVLEELLSFLRTRLPKTSNLNRRAALLELQKICQEEDYSLELPDREDRSNPFLEEVLHVSL
jgi:hypothetical protein